jgi:drug/metabolite transporter (DMT)-like permease
MLEAFLGSYTQDMIHMTEQTTSPELREGWTAAFLSPIFLGLAPIFGKLAFLNGAEPFTVAAARTVVTTVLLWIIYVIFWRKYIYIFPAGLLGCVVIGVVNGIGSLFYYNGLYRLDASLAQVLNATYLIFVVLLARLGGQPLTRQNLIRIFLIILAIILVLFGASGRLDWGGVALMIGNAVMFGGTVILSQRVLYEMPSPTLALYVMTTMAVVTVIARLFAPFESLTISNEAWFAIVALGGSTALARLTLFRGVKELGSLTTALLSVLELVLTLVIAAIILQEQLGAVQWIGAVILVGTLLFIRVQARPKIAEASGHR